MKKILIYAYMQGNLGDDLMVWILCRRYPQVRFRLWADESYKKRYRGLKNLKVYPPGEKKVLLWNRIMEKLKPGKADVFQLLVKKTDALVHIGGSIYMQHDNYMATYDLDRALRVMSRRMYVCGANFGPYQDESYYRQYHELLSFYDGVCFRDTYSAQLFRDLPNVRCAPDIVFNYRPGVERRTEKKQVLMSVIRLRDRTGRFPLAGYADDYRDFLAGLAEYYVGKGYHVKFVSFCAAQGDVEAAQEIIAAMDSEKRTHTSLYSYEMDIQECIGFFEESEIIVGTRFHSIILGWLAEKKVLPIVYGVKTEHLLADNNCRVYIEMEDLQQWKGKGRAELEELDEKIESLPAERLEELKRGAAGQFMDLDALIAGTAG